MRACDHRTIRDTYATVYVHPNKWFEGTSGAGDVIVIPAEVVANPVPPDLDRCK